MTSPLASDVLAEITRLGGRLPTDFAVRDVDVETPAGPHALPASVQALLAIEWPVGQMLIHKDEFTWELVLPAPAETGTGTVDSGSVRAWFTIGHNGAGHPLMVDLDEAACSDPYIYRFGLDGHWYIPRKLSKTLARTKIQRPPSARNALAHACARADIDTARALIAEGASLGPINAAGVTPLHMAAFTSGSPELVRLLVEAGADIDAVITGPKPPSLFSLVASWRLLSRELRPGEAPLSAAVKGVGAAVRKHMPRAVEVVETLLAAGADPNLADDLGHTPLVHACAVAREGVPEVVPMLLAAGADPDPGTGEQSPLYAAAYGEPGPVEALLAAGADPCRPTKARHWSSAGLTPLHRAAIGGLNEVVQLLVDAAKDVDVRTADGVTPLHFAAVNPDLRRLQYFLEAGADPNASMDVEAPFGTHFRQGTRTPLDIAQRGDRDDAVALMKRYV
ncbi:ankyrin repeat domain-containing protein [Actinomycetes bacterium KLBMP 9759]